MSIPTPNPGERSTGASLSAFEPNRSRVFDCFLFFNEMKLLRARIEYLKPVVDYFVIVECSYTHQGKPRELTLPSVAESLPVEAERIIYVPVEDLPEAWDSWAPIERHHRSAIRRGLASAQSGDLVMVADIDEIPRREVVADLRESLVEPVILGLTMMNYYLNLASRRPWNRGTRCVRFRELPDPDDLRYDKRFPIIPNAGWHISYLGTIEELMLKQASYSHIEYSGDRWISVRHLERSRRLGVRFLGAWVLQVIPDTDCFPSMSREKFPDLFHPGRSWLQTLLAYPYALSSSFRNVLPNWLTDGLPPVAFIVAGALFMRLVFLARLLGREDAAQELRDMGYGGF